MIGGFMEDVGRDRPGQIVRIETELGEVLLITADNTDDALGGRVGNDVTTEDILGERRGLL